MTLIATCTVVSD